MQYDNHVIDLHQYYKILISQWEDDETILYNSFVIYSCTACNIYKFIEDKFVENLNLLNRFKIKFINNEKSVLYIIL